MAASKGAALTALGHASSGAVGTALSTACLYPLDLVTTRLKAQQSATDEEHYEGVIDAFRNIIDREGGISALYRGIGADVGKSIVDSFLFFGFYSYLSRRHGEGPQRALRELALGALAGAAARVFTTPISNVVTRKQTSSSRGSLREILVSICRDAGFLGLWSGYSATLVLTLNPSITFLVNRRLARRIIPALQEEDVPVAWVAFLLAASSKSAATAITYPFQTAKTRLQLSSDTEVDKSIYGKHDHINEGKRRRTWLARLVKFLDRSIFGIVLRTIRSEGLTALYSGLKGELLKSFFSHGLTMLTKGVIHRLIIHMWIMFSPHVPRRLRKK